jgi:hypothetical protein
MHQKQIQMADFGIPDIDSSAVNVSTQSEVVMGSFEMKYRTPPNAAFEI